MGSLRSTMMSEKDEELTLFNEMRRREKERNNDLLLLRKSDEFDAFLGSETGTSPAFNVGARTPVRKTVADEFLNSENDKNDYDWLLTPPGTPLFPSLEMESQKTMMSQLGNLKARPTATKSRLANPPEPTARSNPTSRHPSSSLSSNTSNTGVRRPSSSGGSRPSTPTSRPTLSTSRTSLTSSTKPASNAASKTSMTTSTRPSRSATPTSRSTVPSTKPTVNQRSSMPDSRSTARSSTPTRQPISGSKPTSRAATPTRRQMTLSTASNPPSSPSVAKSSASATKNPAPPRASSPTVKPRPWKPSDIPGFSLDAPPNLRTTLPDRPTSATRGRPGVPGARSSSVEPVPNGRVRRQSCSPARGRPPNGVVHSSGSSVPIPAMSRLHAKANDNVSPVLIGTKMVDRVISMRKLAPPKQDNKLSPTSNLSAKSSPESSGFGRNLSKKSLDMAIRHMDIRRTIPGNLRPLMANIPASSMYSVRTGPGRSRGVNVSDSPHATSSNASSEVSINNNNAICADGNEADDDISSYRVVQSLASVRGR